MPKTSAKIKLSSDGRLMLPAKLSQAINIKQEDCFRVELENERLILERIVDCYFCGQPEEENLFRGRQICSSCREDLIDLIS